ncbi:hypothetical protein DL93DRAFT_1506186 [Clavulina sp. PMI_390]|nr:hypothetical protein DL93DRAFT_1506186 [Clavulina sp. PMI_390]
MASSLAPFLCNRWKRDPIGIKIVVSFLLLADIISFALDLGFVWLYLITHFGDFQYIRRSEWVLTLPVMTVIISSTVQCFFAWRVKVLTGKKWLWVILNVASFISFREHSSSIIERTNLTSMQSVVWELLSAAWIVKEFDKFQSFQSVIIVWLTLAATDILIAVILVVQLSRRRNGIADTEDLITRLVRFTIQTGLVTSLWAITDLIVFLTLTNNLQAMHTKSLFWRLPFVSHVLAYRNIDSPPV